MMKTLFLQAPSFDGFDGGAGSRYQAKREIKSFWYPTWLAQPAALVPGSGCSMPPPTALSMSQDLPLARQYDLVIMHTSTPSFPTDAQFAELLKEENPQPADRHGRRQGHGRSGGLARRHHRHRFRGREEFDYTCKEVAEGRRSRPSRDSRIRRPRRPIVHNLPRAMIENMDELPFVAPVYQRDLTIENYFIGYLKHPYVSLLHRPRLPLQVHLLPVAPDRRRPPLPGAQRRERHRGSALDQGEHARSEGDHVRR